MKRPRLLIWFTLLCLIGGSYLVVRYSSLHLPPPISLKTEGQPTIGYPKAAVQVVIFEEPKCSDCQQYNNTIFPTIKKDYIDTNKIRYTVIPISFLPNSMPAAIALLCIYHQDPNYPNPDLFFKFLDYLYHNEPSEHTDWASPDALIEMAGKTDPAIAIDPLRACIDQKTYFDAINQNTDYAKQVLGTIETPSIFVNGRKLNQLTLSSFKKLIDASLLEQGESP